MSGPARRLCRRHALAFQAGRLFRHGGGERVEVGRFVQRGDGAGGAVDQVDLAREGVAEEPGDPRSVTSTRGRSSTSRRQDLETGDPATGGVPGRSHAHKGQCLGDVVARRCALFRRPPGGQRQPLRPLPLLLAGSGRAAVRRLPAEEPGRGRRHGAAVHGVEVAAGWAGRRAGLGSASRWRPAPRTGRRGRAAGRPVPPRRCRPPPAGSRHRCDRVRRGYGSRRARTQPVRSPARGPAVPAAPPCRRRCARGNCRDWTGRRARDRTISRRVDSRGDRTAARVAESEVGRQGADQGGVRPSPCRRGTRANATRRSGVRAASGDRPKTCRPSRICISFNSHRWLSSLASAWSSSSPTRMPQSASSPIRRARSRICSDSSRRRRGSTPAAS